MNVQIKNKVKTYVFNYFLNFRLISAQYFVSLDRIILKRHKSST